MNITICINTDGEAFGDNGIDRTREFDRILHDLSQYSLNFMYDNQPILDSHGSPCGHVKIETEEEDG